MLGFDSSALKRLAVGGAFCIAAAGLVWLVERPRADQRPASPAATAGAVHAVEIGIESTYAVGAWTVSVRGAPAIPAHADAFAWSGRVQAMAGDEVLVVGAAAAAGADAAPNRCLRLRIAGGEPRVVWGGGDVTATADLP